MKTTQELRKLKHRALHKYFLNNAKYFPQNKQEERYAIPFGRNYYLLDKYPDGLLKKFLAAVKGKTGGGRRGNPNRPELHKGELETEPSTAGS